MLVDRIGQPYMLNRQRIQIGASVGISVYPRDGGTVDVLLSHAEGCTPIECVSECPTLLVDAAMHADRRLRFAAVSAIMNLKPEQAFPGSSQVLSALAILGAVMLTIANLMQR